MVNKEDARKVALDLLPGLDSYLSRDLAQEHLSISAEKKRKYYVELLKGLKFRPPSLPPRPEDLPKISQSSCLIGKPNYVGLDQKTDSLIDEQLHEPLEKEFTEKGDDIYEAVSAPPTHGKRLKSDGGDSGTHVESSDDEKSSAYENTQFSPRHEEPTTESKPDEIPVTSLPNVTASGDLHLKGKWKYTKHFCVISDDRLLVYRRERDTRRLFSVTLIGCHCEYVVKEGRSDHVIRISHPDGDTYWFSADLKEIADYWMQHLKAAGANVTSVTPTQAPDSPGLPTDQQATPTNNLSEGGDGDETSRDQVGRIKRTRKKSRLGSISSFLSGTFKKRGEKLRKTVDGLAQDPDVDIANFLDVTQDAEGTNKAWQQQWCVIKNGGLCIYPDQMTAKPEINLCLPGVQIDTAGTTTNRDLCIKLIADGQDSVYLDMPDTAEQGKWLSALFKGRQHQPSAATVDAEDDEAIYEYDKEGPSPQQDELYLDMGGSKKNRQKNSKAGTKSVSSTSKSPRHGQGKQSESQGEKNTSLPDKDDLDHLQDGSDPELYENIDQEDSAAVNQPDGQWKQGEGNGEKNTSLGDKDGLSHQQDGSNSELYEDVEQEDDQTADLYGPDLPGATLITLSNMLHGQWKQGEGNGEKNTSLGDKGGLNHQQDGSNSELYEDVEQEDDQTDHPLPTDIRKSPRDGRGKQGEGNGEKNTSLGDTDGLNHQQDGSDSELYENVEQEDDQTEKVPTADTIGASTTDRKSVSPTAESTNSPRRDQGKQDEGKGDKDDLDHQQDGSDSELYENVELGDDSPE